MSSLTATHRMVTECGSCGSEHLNSVLALRATPPPCSMLKIGDTGEQERFPLELLECADCSLMQLSCVVDPSIVFARDYPYSSGNSGQLRKHFRELAQTLTPTATDVVVDIGANDGTFLSNLECVRLAVEPTDQILPALDAGKIDDAWHLFFGVEVAQEIVRQYGHARYVTAFNVLAHVADPHDFLEGVRILLGDEGKFITENGSVDQITAGEWDFVYHEHLRYYSPRSLASLLDQHGLHVYLTTDVETHGGSFRMWASTTPFMDAVAVTNLPETNWRKLREDVARQKWYLRSLVSAARAHGDRIAAVGATARATTILNHCGFDHDDIEAVYEVEGSDKIGRYMPGTRIPVLDERELIESAPEIAIVLSWHLADLIIPNLRRKGYAGEFVIPLPKLRFDMGTRR